MPHDIKFLCVVFESMLEAQSNIISGEECVVLRTALFSCNNKVNHLDQAVLFNLGNNLSFCLGSLKLNVDVHLCICITFAHVLNLYL